ncbi:flagellar export chaperone FliS [Neomoorella thermoacetica]|uniref:flagellar export chaperone FliS n=1 Tax=Neomoorella thermoacetica TaxID=1525 RepID=UPI0008FB61C7|nr:flagellar export chaperone FliS [Moorella thermoacetica]OIQ55624.1 flagellar protein FliS [Moorella thermoacetica]
MALNPYQIYQQNAVMMAGPGELTAMLYEGAIRFLNQARQAITKKDIPAAHQSLIRAQDIISYLNNTVNTTYEVGANLAAIYDYVLRRLVEANMKKDAAIIDEAIDLIKDLSATWREAMTRARQNGAGAP